MIQCYFKDTEQCKNAAQQDLEYWCSEEHKAQWQDSTYGIRKNKAKKWTVKAMADRLLELSQEAKFINKKNGQAELI